MTKNEIKTELDKLGIEYDARLGKSKLEGILNKALEANKFEAKIIDESEAERTSAPPKHERLTLSDKIANFGQLLKELQTEAKQARSAAETPKDKQAAVQCERFTRDAVISFNACFYDSQVNINEQPISDKI